MENDLISKEALLKALQEKVYPERYGERCNALDVINGVLQVIEEQPTSYDVDKVVEQVREFHRICDKCLNNKNSIATCATFCDMGKELETIKTGGVS